VRRGTFGDETSDEDEYIAFIRGIEAELRHALVARFGTARGTEAHHEALAFAWEHWDRVRALEKPIAYLFTVGRSRTRQLWRSPPALVPTDKRADENHFEPKLARAVEGLSPRQRTAVVLVVGFGWSYTEVAELLSIKKATVQRHVDRGLAALRGALGVEESDRD
jgi:RNA polymerase sigma factor (sigma-70 family)